MAINSNRKFKSNETGRRFRVDNNYGVGSTGERKYMAMLWDSEAEMYRIAVNGLGDVITGKTIKDVQRAVNVEDFWITTYTQWLNEEDKNFEKNVDNNLENT